MIKLFVNIDENGNITDSTAGDENLIINAAYGLYFEVDSWDIPMNIQNYKVENGQLVQKELQ